VLIEFVHRKIWDGLCTYNPGKGVSFMTWLHSVVDSAMIDYRRRSGLVETVPIDDSLVSNGKPEPAVEHERRAESAALCAALSKLSSPRRREILLLLAVFPNISNQDIVRIMRLPNLRSARQLKYCALKEIRIILAVMRKASDAFGTLLR
jgi:DNA-directed RNA polymerase specialized sigma24 family protein